MRWFLLGTGLCLALQVQAFRPVPLTVEQMATKADLILHGTVATQSCQRDDAGRIYTRVELKVIGAWKGKSAGPTFDVVHSGGILGEEKTVVDGQAAFSLGEEVVVFLVKNRRGQGAIVGLSQGKFRIGKTPDGQTVAENPWKAGSDQARSRHGALPLTELKRRVHDALAAN